MRAAITRKQFLVGAGATGGAVMLRPFVARAASPTVIKFGFILQPDELTTQHMVLAGDRIKTETNGEIDVQVFPNGQLGGNMHMLSAVRSGAIQMMGIADNVLAVLALSAAIDNVGFAFKDTKTVFAALDGAVGDIVRQDVEKFGLHPMHAVWDEGFHVITTSTKPIETPLDLKGFKIRVPESPIFVSLFNDLGAAPVTIGLTELYTALQTHVVDGQETPLATIESEKLYQIQKYCSLTNQAWNGFWIIANGTFWKRLPAGHQKIIADAFDSEALKERVAQEALNSSVQGQLASQGLKFNKPDAAPFKEQLVKSGFYSHWRKKFGSELWSTLEKYTGTLA